MLVVDVLLPGAGMVRQGSGTQVVVAVAVGAIVPVGDAVVVVVAGTQAGVVVVLVLVLVAGGALVVVTGGQGIWVVAGIDDVGTGARGVTAGFVPGAVIAGWAVVGRGAGLGALVAGLGVRDATVEAFTGARSTAGRALTPWR